MRELIASPSFSRTIGTGMISQIEVQIADHFLNRAKLLKILLAEDRQMRFHNVEELRDYRRDAAKMPGAMRAAETAA